jgi:hypothetical protein
MRTTTFVGTATCELIECPNPFRPVQSRNIVTDANQRIISPPDAMIAVSDKDNVSSTSKSKTIGKARPRDPRRPETIPLVRHQSPTLLHKHIEEMVNDLFK